MATKVDTVVSIVLDASGVAVGFKDINGQVRNLQGQFLKLKEGMTQVEKGSNKFAESIGTVVTAAKKQNDALKSVSRETSTFKGTLEGMFRPVTALNQAFGVLQQSLYIIQRAFSLTVGSAMELELQVARITTVLDKSEVGQVDFAKRILDMQATFGANPTEAAKGFYEAIASGATNAAGSIALMNTAQKLAIGGLLPLDKALSGLTSVMASYGYTADETKYISDAFFIAAAKGKTNVEELTMEIGNVASISQQAGVSFEELVSAISAVTLGGKRTAEATTSVRSAINALLTPTEQLQYVYNQLGISSITAEIRQRGLAAVYQDIYGYVNNNADALSKLVGRVEAISAVVALTSGKQKKSYQEMIASITDSNKKMGDTTEKAFKLLEQTSANRMEIAKGKILASFTEISNAAMKLIIPIAELGASILDKLMKPIVATSNAISSMIDGMNSLMPTLAAFATTIVVFKSPAILTFFTALAPVLKAVVVPATLLAAKFIGIAAAITAVTVVFDQIFRNFNLIPTVFEYVLASIEQFNISMSAKLNTLLESIVNFAKGFTEKFPDLSKAIGLKVYFDAPKEQAKRLGDELEKVAERAKKAKEKISKEWDMGAIKGIKDAFGALSGAFGGAPEVPGPSRPLGAPKLPEIEQGKPIDIEGSIEAGKKATEQLNAMLDKTREYENEIALSKVTGNDALIMGIQLEMDRLDEVSKQADAYKSLTSEQLKNIDKLKEKAAEALKIKIDKENIKQITSMISSAFSGAEAFASKTIKAAGAAAAPFLGLPPEVGEMVGEVINGLRQGKDFVKNVVVDIFKIFSDLPMMIANGVEGLMDGILETLSDPAAWARIITSIVTIPAKIITGILKGLPAILKVLFDPKFWKELISQFVRTLWEAVKELFVALGDLIASIFTGDIFGGAEEEKKAGENFGTTAAQAFNSSIQMSTGYGEQLFGVQNEQIQTALSGVEQTATKINTAFSDGVQKQDGWWTRFRKGWVEFWDKTGNWMDQNIWQPIGKMFNQFGTWLDEKIWQPIGGMFTRLGNWFNELGTGMDEKIWQPIGKAIGGLFKEETWIKLGDNIAKPFSKFGNWLEEIFTIPSSAYGKKGPVEEFLGWDLPWVRFAEGGTVPGKASVFGDSLKNDTVPALLSPGEVVIPRSIMNDPAAAKLIYSLMQGKDVGMHASGFFENVGAVLSGDKSISEALSDAGEAVTEGFKKIGGFLMPDWLVGIYESAKNFISGIDIKKLIDDPSGVLKDAIKGAFSFLTDMVKKIFSMNVKGYATGGLVPGTGFTDSVPAMLTPGEFVINRNAAQALGSGLLNQLNAGRMPTQETAPIFNINLNIETKDALDATFIRNTLLPTIKNELKASSLRGDFVLSAKGVRR